MKRTSIQLLIAAILALVPIANVQAQNIYLSAGSASGICGSTGDGGAPLSAELCQPHGICFDRFGNTFIADYNNNRIRKISGGIITTIAGNGSAGFFGDGGPATAATCEINNPMDVTTDYAGNVYFSDYENNRIRMINATTGIITTVAGGGTVLGDGGPATAGELASPVGVVFDKQGNMFIGDQFDNRIRKVTPAGVISTFAGNGTGGFIDDAPATSAELHYATWLRFDMWGNLFFDDRENSRIRMVSTSGIMSSVAGTGTAGFAGDGTPATNAEFAYVMGGIRFDGAGNLYIADGSNYNLREIKAIDGHIASTDIINSIAGTHSYGFTGDGGPATAATFSALEDPLLDSTGDIYVSDDSNDVVRFIDIRNERPRFTGGTQQTLSVCENTTFDSINSLLTVVDTNVGQQITWNLFSAPAHGTAFAHDSVIDPGAGTPTLTPTGLYYTPNTNYSGPDTFRVWVNDGHSLDTVEIAVTVNSKPVVAPIQGPTIVCPGNTITLTDDSTGGSWSSSSSSIAPVSGGVVTGGSAGTAIITYSISNSCGATNALYTVRVGDPIINAFAGGGTSLGDGGPATAAELDYPTCIFVDASNDKLITDYEGNRVRMVNPTGTISTIAGTGTGSSSGDGFPATSAEINGPAGVFKDVSGNIYIAEQGGCRVRKVNSSGIITTIAGTGTCSSTGDGLAATAATLNAPTSVAADAAGNIYIAEWSGGRVRKINTSGIISTLAGGGGVLGDDGPATAAIVANPYGIYYDGVNSLFIAEQAARVRVVNLETNIINTFAGTGTSGFTGDNGPATSAEVGNLLCDVYADAINVYIADYENHRIRMVNKGTGIISTVVGNGATTAGGNGGPATAASIGSVSGIALDAAGDIFITDFSNNLAREVSMVDPTVTAISGPSILCVGSSITLVDTTSGGTWSSANPVIASVGSTGIVTGNNNGVTDINYTVTYSCGTLSVTYPVTVNGLPSPISPGSASLCVGTSVALTDATSGGTWSSNNSDAGVVGGTVTGLVAGLDTISYTVSGCSSTAIIEVTAGPDAISPASAAVCAGSMAIFTDGTSGGTWSVSNAHAIIAGGTATGESAGVDTISYSIGTSCIAKAYVTVNTAPMAISPSSATVCNGSSTTLTDATGGGTWSASNSHATVSGGLVTAVSVGVDTISYSIGSCVATSIITIVTAPAAISPGNASVCTGSSITLTESSSGGVWSQSNPNATVVGGIVTGISAGDDTIAYTIGSCFAKAYITVNTAPAAILPSGPVSICVGSSATLTDMTTGDTWSSSAPGIASVVGGVVTGVAPGTATISYASAAGCSATKIVTVVTAPAAISPATSSVCIGNTDNLTETTLGGVWSASNAAVTVVGGLVTGISTGVDTINYTLGTCVATAYVTVNPLPNAITPSGPVSMCVGASATLSDTSPSDTWSSGSPSTATVTAGGIVTGVAPGSVTILYTNSFGCSATKIVTIDVTPSAISPASATVCTGTTVTLTDGVGGGLWSSSASGTASVAGGSVMGVTVGTATITYTIGTCTVTAPVTVSTAPVAGSISGPSAVCVGSSITLIDAASGGIWSSAEPAFATVSGSGVVLGVGGGIATISYTVTNACGAIAATATVDVVPAGIAAIVGASSVCAGTFTTLTDATTGGSWSASNSHATVAGAGFVTGVSVGTDTITYTVVNVCGTASTTKVITIGPYLTAGTITGGSGVCVGSNIILADLAPSGVWSATNGDATVAGGVVTGVSGGKDTINYTVTSGCGSAVATHVVTVTPIPTAGSITGPASICIGTFMNYTDAATGGVWGITNAHATITVAGLLTPVTVGTDTITYTVTNACGTASTSKVITVGALLSGGTITGPSSVCTGSSISLTDATTGGVWSSSNAHATIGSSGSVTGVSAGVDTISYTVTSSCGSASATKLLTVNPVAVAGSISGAAIICLGTPSTYIDGATGGVWSMSNALATISGAGTVNPVTPGIDTVIYSVSSVCGTVTATKPVTIGTTVTVDPLAGPGDVCTGSSITLTDGTSGGVWSAGNGHASVAGGVVTGITAGVDTISYTESGSCGSAVATAIVTVSPVAVAGTIVGPSTICTGSFTIYTDASPGGIWAISNPSASITGGGLVTGITPGIDTITYTVITGCSAASTTKAVTISTSPTIDPISGATTTLCFGSSITLSDATSGGLWSSSNGHASVNSSGVVTGLSAGIDTISYSLISGCGTVSSTYTVTVSSSTTTGSIAGPPAVCLGSSITLTDGITGGTWSSSNANATVSSSGVVNGIAQGSDTISYSVSGICGLASATTVITIDTALSAGTVSGPDNVCVGSSITLMDPATGGSWSALNPYATVSSGGVVTGVTGGADIISYSVSNGCGVVAATMIVSVNPTPSADTITGADSVCLGSTVNLSDAAGGGTWSAGNANATVSSSGIVLGLSVGADTISYTVTNSCGTATTTSTIIISTTPSAGVISGIPNVCVGSGITLTDGVPGGTWVSSNTSAMVTGPGIIEGVTVGVDTILYLVTTSCGSSNTYKVMSVNPVPVVAAISGPTSQCTSTTVTLTDPTPTGVWTSSSPSVATIGLSTGIVTGLSVGVTTLTYTVTNSFGCPASVTAPDTVSVSSMTSPITGSTSLCEGTSVTLSNSITGGVWSSSVPSIASIGSGSGIVIGISTGTVTISYMVASSCGSAYITTLETVNPIPSADAISGASGECEGATTPLTDATPGGVWSSSNISVATVGATSGIVSGVSAGTATISYLVTSPFGCGSSFATIPNTVSAAPVVAAITGVTNECAGSSATLSDATSGGAWSSSNASIATVSGGVVTGVAGGVVAISYIVGAGGCTSYATISDTVNTIPVSTPITGSSNVCVGSSATLADASFGGVWSSHNTTVATISSTGVVHGVAAGTDEIYYAVSNSCGAMTDSTMITVDLSGSAGTISGSSGVCQGASTTLTDAATGGVWSASNGKATVSGGVVTGVSAGIDTIKYTVTSSSCGAATAIKPISVNSAPSAGSISGDNSVCAGMSVALSESTSGGSWSSSNNSVASVSGGSVTGVAPGSATISYSVSNSCGTRSATYAVTVVPATDCNTQVGNTGPANSDIKVYPNPAALTLYIDAPVKVNVSLLSIDGKVVITQNNTSTIDVSSLANGMYLVMIYDGQGVLLKTTKFAKTE